jgi:hypothetical protein
LFFYATGSDLDLLYKTGWQHTDGIEGGASSEAPSGDSLYLERINAILFYNKSLVSKWKLATDFCVSLGGPLTRHGRVKIFKKIAGGSL